MALPGKTEVQNHDIDDVSDEVGCPQNVHVVESTLDFWSESGDEAKENCEAQIGLISMESGEPDFPDMLLRVCGMRHRFHSHRYLEAAERHLRKKEQAAYAHQLDDHCELLPPAATLPCLNAWNFIGLNLKVPDSILIQQERESEFDALYELIKQFGEEENCPVKAKMKSDFEDSNDPQSDPPSQRDSDDTLPANFEDCITEIKKLYVQLDGKASAQAALYQLLAIQEKDEPCGQDMSPLWKSENFP